jgi:hypothetical protein
MLTFITVMNFLSIFIIIKFKLKYLSYRVLMLVEGNVFFDGSVNAFDELACLFYQVDLLLPPSDGMHSKVMKNHYINSTNVDVDHISTPVKYVIERISQRIGGEESFERIVEYSPILIRLTFEKKIVPLTHIWYVCISSCIYILICTLNNF